MKSSRKVLTNTALMVLVIGSMIISLVSAGTPTPPHNFQGTLYIDGSPAPAGTEIRAFVGTTDVTKNATSPVPYFSTVVGEYGSGFSNLEVDCVNDDVITFKINSVTANEQYICERGDTTDLPLSSGSGNPECQEGETQPCYTGPQGTEGVGECSSGTQSCVDLYWGTCTGDVIPVSETCDGLDNDCDGTADEGVQTTFYMDSDDDTYGDLSSTTQACEAPQGYVADSTDCDDTMAGVNPGAAEVCDNEADDDCDGSTDCLDSDCDEACTVSYCIEITGLRVLDSMFNPVSEVEPGTMYNIEMTNENTCEDPIESLQIVQISTSLVPVNIGSVKSTIGALSESVVTAGFVLPNDTASGTTFDVDAYNWNMWDMQDQSWEALSEPASTSFTAQASSV